MLEEEDNILIDVIFIFAADLFDRQIRDLLLALFRCQTCIVGVGFVGEVFVEGLGDWIRG
jgi:hypothetical protein